MLGRLLLGLVTARDPPVHHVPEVIQCHKIFRLASHPQPQTEMAVLVTKLPRNHMKKREMILHHTF